MIVLRDDGVYRHIRFKKPGTGCMHFDLVTWPGYLCYSGDMGCYVFCRLNARFSPTEATGPRSWRLLMALAAMAQQSNTARTFSAR